MKAELGVNFHNRFDIIKNGEWIGYAENIILNSMYSRLVNLSSFFSNIHFGTGAGTPTSERNSLFNHLSTKTAETEETIRALPTSKWTCKITLNPEEFIGQTITEVGIAWSSTSTDLLTHAMLKDAEGNLLSITKSDLDVVVIYATIFITLVDPDDKFKFEEATENYLLEYLLTSTQYLDLFQSRIVGGTGKLDNRRTLDEYSAVPLITIDEPNRKRIASARFGVYDHNSSIFELGLFRVLCLKLPHPSILASVSKQDVHIGVGDGIEVDFPIEYLDSTLSVKVDGVVTSDYTLIDTDYEDSCPFLPIRSIVDDTEFYSPSLDTHSIFKNHTKYESGSYLRDRSFHTFNHGDIFEFEFKSIKSLKGKKFEFYGKGNSVTQSYQRWTIRSSTDGDNWTERNVDVGGGGLTDPLFIDITTDDLYYKISLAVNSASNENYRAVYYAGIAQDNNAKIRFNNPPPIDAVIKADIVSPYIQKDENYVLDVAFEIQFGEGV